MTMQCWSLDKSNRVVPTFRTSRRGPCPATTSALLIGQQPSLSGSTDWHGRRVAELACGLAITAEELSAPVVARRLGFGKQHGAALSNAGPSQIIQSAREHRMDDPTNCLVSSASACHKRDLRKLVRPNLSGGLGFKGNESFARRR